MTGNGAYKKQLEGVRSTPDLRSLLLKSTDRVVASNHPSEDPATQHAVARATAQMPLAEAFSLLTECGKQSDSEAVIPLSVVKAMHSVFLDDKQLLSQLETALSKTNLVYTSPPPAPAETTEQRKFKKRMDRLKLKAEENRYKNLTSNLAKPKADDVTTRSMTYAASVGLNMIIAPISFGAFMYFFAAPLFSWVSGGEVERDPNETDIRRVIAGVVCGVGMLFIEMILFVIRTHEFDASMRKKSRTSPSPFGYTKPKVSPSS